MGGNGCVPVAQAMSVASSKSEAKAVLTAISFLRAFNQRVGHTGSSEPTACPET